MIPTNLETHPKFVKRLIDIITQIRTRDYAEPFAYPVDWKAMKLTEYPKIVHYPMDLETILKKLKNGDYKSIKEVEYDVYAIWRASLLFNGDLHDFTKRAEKVCKEFENGLNILRKEYYETNKQTIQNLKKRVYDKILALNEDTLAPLFTWLTTLDGVVKENEHNYIFDMEKLNPQEIDMLLRYLDIS